MLKAQGYHRGTVESATRPQPLGRREVQKQLRFERIQHAARELFLKKGFAGTTMRQIARRARVGLGTIFRHVADKRDLLFLLFAADHKAVTQAAFAALPDAALLDRLLHAFGHYYRYFAAQPDFARAVLQEITFYPRRLADQTDAPGQQVRLHFCQLIETARARGEIRGGEDAAMIALLIFDIYQAECRRWLADARPDVAVGLAALRCALAVVVRGLVPDAKAATRFRR